MRRPALMEMNDVQPPWLLRQEQLRARPRPKNHSLVVEVAFMRDLTTYLHLRPPGHSVKARKAAAAAAEVEGFSEGCCWLESN